MSHVSNSNSQQLSFSLNPGFINMFLASKLVKSRLRVRGGSKGDICLNFGKEKLTTSSLQSLLESTDMRATALFFSDIESVCSFLGFEVLRFGVFSKKVKCNHYESWSHDIF